MKRLTWIGNLEEVIRPAFIEDRLPAQGTQVWQSLGPLPLSKIKSQNQPIQLQTRGEQSLSFLTIQHSFLQHQLYNNMVD